MRFLVALTLALTGSVSSFASTIENDKMALLGKFFSNKKIQAEIFRDNYYFVSLYFIEADDGGTEPLYKLITARNSQKRGANTELRCYYVEFDTDEPTKLPALIERKGDLAEDCLKL